MKLDRKKPYGEQFPPIKWKYTQNDHEGKERFFDDDGNEVNPNTGELVKDSK